MKTIRLDDVLRFIQREIKKYESLEHDCNYTDDRDSMRYYNSKVETLKEIESQLKSRFG